MVSGEHSPTGSTSLHRAGSQRSCSHSPGHPSSALPCTSTHPKPSCWTQGRPARVGTVCDTRFVFGTAQDSAGHFTQRGPAMVQHLLCRVQQFLCSIPQQCWELMQQPQAWAPQNLNYSYLQAEMQSETLPHPSPGQCQTATTSGDTRSK